MKVKSWKENSKSYLKYVVAICMVLTVFGLGVAGSASTRPAAAALPPAGPAGSAYLPSSSVVISHVFGGNGSLSAYCADFIELFNRGTTPASLNGWSLQYASAANNFSQVTQLLNFTLQPGQYYLYQAGNASAPGTCTPLPTPDQIGTSGVTNLSSTNGKVALVSNTTLLTCGATGARCTTDPNYNQFIVDFVGYGTTASDYEGTAPTGTLSTSTAAIRASGGCVDTDQNSTDLPVGPPLPRNSSSPLRSCVEATVTPSVTLTVVPTSTATDTPVVSTATITATSTPGAPASIIINELDADQLGTDSQEFVELYDGGAGNSALDGLVIVFYNGSTDVSYGAFDLDGYSTDASGYFVLGNVAVPGVDLVFADNFLQNGQDAVALYTGDAANFPNGTPVTTANLIDAVVYDTDDPDDPGLLVLLNPGQPQVNENEGGNGVIHSIQRCPNGSGGARNTDTYSAFGPNPGTANTCAPVPTSTATITTTPTSTSTPGGATATLTSTPVVGTVRIHDIQGAQHRSPFEGTPVTNVPGIVTGLRSNGFYFQDPMPDADEATSEGLFVFTSSAPSVSVGDSILVSGTVSEFRPGGSSSANLSTSQIGSPTINVVATGVALPTPVVVGIGGRIPPNMIINNDSTGDVETSGVFDPAEDGIDFYESMEAMRLQVNNPVAVGPTSAFGEIAVLSDDGANASVRTTRGGIVIRPDDFNPERIILDDSIMPVPNVHVGDHFSGPAIGILDYGFGNFKLNITQPLTGVPGGIQRETTTPPGTNQLTVGNFNVENLHPGDPPSKFAALAALIVNNMLSPDILAIEEVQDNNGPTNDSVVDADITWGMLITAIQTAGGPTYQYRQINPVDDQDGGQPGGNIRQGFLFRTDRGVQFIDRPGGCSTCDTSVVAGANGPELSFSPGRIRPTATAFARSRKPLAGEFTYNGHKLFLIGNHLSSKGGDHPLFGRFQPPVRSSEIARHQQAQIINDFVDAILAQNSAANVIVLGDINDFYFSTTVNIIEGSSPSGGPVGGAVLQDMIETLPLPERYTYVFDGNSQDLDNTIVSLNLLNNAGALLDVVHVNAEFHDQISDHDPQVTRFNLPPAATVTAIPSVTSTLTAIPTGTNTAISTPTGTNTTVPTTTSTTTAIPTATLTSTAVPTSTATRTAIPTATFTNTPVPSSTTTQTALPSATLTRTVVATPTGTVCAQQLLLIPDWTNDRVMAFDPFSGEMVNPNFIPSDPTNLASPKNAILSAAGNTILVADQIRDVVQEYSLSGSFIRTFAPSGGPNTAILDNILGIELRPNGNLLVTVTGGTNADSVAQFDINGAYLGNFIANGAGGLDGPFDILRRTTVTGTDYLVPAIGSDDVHRYDANGAFLDIFTSVNNFPEQANFAANGNVLVANFSGTETGVLEYTPGGAFVGRYAPVTGNRGVYELGNGNLLTTHGTSVTEINRAGQVVSTKATSVSAQYIELVTIAGPCVTVTPVASVTRTSTAVATATRTVTTIPTLTRTVTVAPSVTRTSSVAPSVTRTVTMIVPTSTNTAVVPSSTTVPSVTRTSTAAPSMTTQASATTVPATSTAIATRTETALATNTATVVATATPCTVIFTDVPSNYVFYSNIQCLACRGVISGYECGGVNPETGQPEPCDANENGYFRPENRVVRGQIAKMVSNSAGYQEPVSGQTYADVPPTDTFYVWIERLSSRGVMGGYECGGVNPNTGQAEPCDAANRPYFRPYSPATRGQVAKIDANGAGFNEPIPSGQQTFADVPPGSTFWVYIERLADRGIISGVDCGGTDPETGQPEPCDDEDRPYFRPNNRIKRGQTSKFVANTFFPECAGLNFTR